METIKNYIENLFSGLPKNTSSIKAKEELLSNMEDKYNELKNEGKSENEAIGIVISEFGNIDELIKELGINVEAKNSDKRTITLEEAEKFLEVKKETGKIIALGVMLCILGVAALVLISSLINGLGAGIGVLIMFVMIAAGVALFIPAGIKLSKYEYLKSNIYLPDQLKLRIEEKREAFIGKFITSIVLGVVLCILSVTPIILLSMLRANYSHFGAVILLVIVSIAVFLFVSAGSLYGAYDMLLQRGDYTPKNKKSEKIVSAVASVVWPLTVIAFLIWGFIFDGWHISWILFPIVGITFGAFSALTSALMDDK